MTMQRAAIAVVIVIGLIGLWKLLHPTHSYRYRLTIEVEKNGEVHSGSSVVELNTTRNFFLSALDTVPDWATAYRGEAVFVDLGGGDHLIALLDSENGPAPTVKLPSRVILGDEIARKGPPGTFDVLTTLHPDRLADARGRWYSVDLDHMPPLIRFRQIDDPLTVESVDSADLSSNYGPGVVLRGARLEISSDAVTESIVTKLPWLPRLRPNKALSGRVGSLWQAGEMPFSTPNQIAYWNFKSE